MEGHDAKTVTDLLLLVRDGERREFKRRAEPTGDEPAFCRMATAGEYQELPRWLNAVDVELRPRPAAVARGPIPLASIGTYNFSVKAKRGELADLYFISPGIFLVSASVQELLTKMDPGSVEVAPAEIGLSDGNVTHDFKVVMPLRVLDVVDTSKSDVVIARDEVVKGLNRYVTRVSLPNGFVVRPDLDPSVMSFVGLHIGKWWWREELIRQAEQLGLQGLRAVPAQPTARRREIRT